MRKLRDHLNNVWRPRSVYRRLDDIEHTLQHLHKLGHQTMATMEENLALVAEQSTRLDSIITLIDTTKAELDAILAGQLPASVQAQVDALFDGLKGNDAKIDDALNTNVPPSEPLPDEPPANP